MNRRYGRHLALGTAALCAVVTTIAGTSFAQVPPESLVLWNKLGSDVEVLNSAYGPNLEFYVGGGWPHVQGDSIYVPGVFGNAVTLAGGPYSNMSRIHNIVFNNLPDYLDPERGTVEVWYQQTTDPVGYSHGVYRVFGGGYGLGGGIALHSMDLIGGQGPRFLFGLSLGGASTQVYSLEDGIVGCNISPHNQTWIHLAGVWDRNGIDGTADTMRLYRDGLVVASTSENSWGTTVGNRVDICGGNDHNILGKFYMDNLKVWDYARTDFCDRFVESPLACQLELLDIKPGSCPNPVNRGSQGVLPVAVVGTVDFDVTQIDVSTVRLSRADGVGGQVAPSEGPPGPHSTFQDVATPFEGEACECHGVTGDGIDDLSLKFRTGDVVAALLLSTFEPGDEVELVVTGTLLDGSAFTTAGDCIRIVPSRTSSVRAKAGQASGRPGRFGGRRMTAGQRP